MLAKKMQGRLARKRRIRAKVRGTRICPRLCVYKSHTQMMAQAIDDDAGCTLVAASTKEIGEKPTVNGAKKLGEAVAKKAKKAKIECVVFDRSGYPFRGKVQVFADAAREGGLRF